MGGRNYLDRPTRASAAIKVSQGPGLCRAWVLSFLFMDRTVSTFGHAQRVCGRQVRKSVGEHHVQHVIQRLGCPSEDKSKFIENLGYLVSVQCQQSGQGKG